MLSIVVDNAINKKYITNIIDKTEAVLKVPFFRLNEKIKIDAPNSENPKNLQIEKISSVMDTGMLNENIRLDISDAIKAKANGI